MKFKNNRPKNQLNKKTHTKPIFQLSEVNKIQFLKINKLQLPRAKYFQPYKAGTDTTLNPKP